MASIDQERTATTPGDASDNEIERCLEEIWGEVLENRGIRSSDDFFSLGGDSLLAMEMLEEIEQRLGCSLSPGVLIQAPTIEALAAVIRGGSADGLPDTKAGEPPLFLAYPLGGTSLRYRWLMAELRNDLTIHALEAPWWDGKPSEIRTVEQLARHHVAEIQALQPEGPYLLAGSSFGGVVALEIARALVAQGQQVALLAVFDTYIGETLKQEYAGYQGLDAPRVTESTGPLGRALARAKVQVRRNIRPIRRALVLANHARWRLEQRRVGKVRDRRRAPYVNQMLEEVLENYDALPYAGKVTLFRCMEDEWKWPEPDLGWGPIAQGGLELHDLPSLSHGEQLEPPFVTNFASRLLRLVREASNTPAALQPSAASVSDLGDVVGRTSAAGAGSGSL